MDILNPSTLEEAREAILEWQRQRDELEAARSALETELNETKENLEEVRTLNQRLYLRVSQGSEEPEEDPEPSETLEDFAIKNLKGMIR